ncbi:MAG: cupin domain-containing protein [Myxococcaceae bacterium]
MIERSGAPLHFVDLTVLPPGADVGRHTHAKDNEELYVIISGRGRMQLDEREFEVGPGDVILNRPGGTHALTNTSNEELRIVVVEVSAQEGGDR